jgi:CMP-N-acetylneuraminic acid synthetase
MSNVPPRLAAIVPMRHTSERVPGKNYRTFVGKPLYRHIVQTLLACPEIDVVLIDTDSPTILDDARREFPNVVLYERPEDLRDAGLSMNTVLANSMKQVEAEFYLQTHSTNPLLRSATISQAIGRFFAHYPANDSLFSVTRLQQRLWNESGKPLNHDPRMLKRTQDLPPVYQENSLLFLFSAASFREAGNRIGSTPILFETDPTESVDIDEPADFELAECLYRLGRQTV